MPDWYLDAPWVDHGYALTAHKLQSTTVDRTFALATDGLYQVAGYSIATRARHETHFYLASRTDLPHHERGHGPPEPEPARACARTMNTTALREEHDRIRQALDRDTDRRAGERREP